MTTAIKYLALPVLAAAMLSSCQQSGPSGNNKDTSDTTVAVVSAPVALADVPVSPEFPVAKLEIGKVTAVAAGDSAKVSFEFKVSNYELKNQTSDATDKHCNNSDKGQHIHFILDNKPYTALYEPKHEVTLAKNTEHYLMAFLSRSYHESIKDKGAAVVYHFKIDDKGQLQKMDEPKTPMVFYSRPKGDYLGKDTENVLFDFYVWNASLGSDYQVRADVHTGDKDTSFMISEWKPRFLKNLQMGTSSIKLTLVDKAGKKVEGPETEVTREFKLAKDEPMK